MEDEILTEELDDALDNDAQNADDDEFERDEEGNIIIPEIELDEEFDDGIEDGDDASDDNVADDAEDVVDDEDDEDDGTDTDGDDTPDADEGAEEPTEEEEPEQTDGKYDKLVSQIRETLRDLGEDVPEDIDITDLLVKISAESSGKTIEDYLKEKGEREKVEEAIKFKEADDRRKKQEAFAQRAELDLLELQKYFPETKKYKSLFELPNIKRFAELMGNENLALTAKEAYIASHPDAVMASVADSVKQQNLSDTKNHMKSVVPKGAKDDSLVMPRSELNAWREMFPDKNDQEILSLWRATHE